MADTTMMHVRLDARTKKAAEAVFAKLGLTTSDAVRLFFRQVHLQKGLPFAVKIPNAETRKAMQEAAEGKVTRAKDWDELMRSMRHDA